MENVILIIDDDRTNIVILSEIFKGKYKTLGCLSCEEGLSVLKRPNNNIVGIIVDLIMPGMNGFDFIKTVKNDMKLISIPIFAMTSYASNENKRLAIESGATDFIFMPFEPMMVINRVDTSIRLNLAIYAKDRLIREANRDELTSLMNRKSLLNSIQADWVNKSTSTCSLIMVDLDNLKTINDQYGHAVGDICLRRLADFLKAHFTDDGYIGRIGGDEFMIYLPKVNDEKSLKTR